ncbi:hypothetical protein C8Q76DRAFT_798371 [Earliella scabrosa]|nr:hypothetical protein C8Q76DRAFT_798371 [Earliella scabrosa]
MSGSAAPLSPATYKSKGLTPLPPSYAFIYSTVMSVQSTSPGAFGILDGVISELPGRDPNLPPLVRVPSHVLLRHVNNVRNVYIMPINATPEDQARFFHRFAKTMKLPPGTYNGVTKAGYAILEPGSYVFGRNMVGTCDPLHDELLAYVVPEGIIGAELEALIHDARDQSLGAREKRGANKARVDADGNWTDGVRWERSPLAVNVEGAPRCYTIGQSYQAPRNMSGPARGARVGDGDIREHHLLRQKIAEAGARVGIASLQAAPVSLYNTLRAQADLINLPPLGHRTNFAFPTMQLNLASAVHAASNEESLAAQLGPFGVPHADENDSPAGLTAMISDSDLDDTVLPGYFMVGELGIAVELKGLVVFLFSGLFRHGGYPPIDTANDDPSPHNYRWALILYPSRPIMDGTASVSFAVSPTGSLVYMPPEMIHPDYDGVAPQHNCSTWLSSAPALTDAAGFMQWYYQSICQQLAFYHRQVSPHFDIRLDLAALRHVFYIEDPYQHLEEIFSLRNLLSELAMYTKAADNITSLRYSPQQEQTLEQFLASFHSENRMKPAFAERVARMWPVHQARTCAADIYELTLAAERRRVMIAGVAAWYWLMQECAKEIFSFAEGLTTNASSYDTSDYWLCALTRDVFHIISSRTITPLQPTDYLPGIKDPAVYQFPKRLQPSTVEYVCSIVLAVLRRWLKYPSNTDMVVSYFIIHIVQSFGSPDVLLFQGLWKSYRDFKTVVLNVPTMRHSSIKLSMLKPVVEALRNYPLADPESTEREVLSRISCAVQRCAPVVRDLVDQHTSALFTRISSAIALTDNNLPLYQAPPELSVNGPAVVSRPGPRQRELGLINLLQFVRTLLPVVSGQPASGRIPTIVSSDLDYFSPFRELAPCRRRVTDKLGPFHPDNIRKSGAFASCVVSRALLYNSLILKEDTHCFFPNLDAWELFKTAVRFDSNDAASLDRFFNVSCYGTPQYERRDGMELVPVYYESERDWTQYLAEHPGRIPFLECWKWLKQQVKRQDPKQGKERRQSRLPLVGNLTAYLLAADLVYATVVQAPSHADLAHVIHKNRMGSLSGLAAAKQISNAKATESTVLEAFSDVFSYLQDNLSDDEKKLIKFDAIMVEHLLCKYQRVLHRVGTDEESSD